MGNYWIVHLPHVLDEKGTLRGLAGCGLRLAKFLDGDRCTSEQLR